MFTVLGTWEVIGEVQGERYIQPLTFIAQGGRWRGGEEQEAEEWKQRRAEWHREIFLLSVTENQVLNITSELSELSESEAP